MIQPLQPISNVNELAAAIADATQRNDLAALQSLEQYFKPSDTPPPLPLMPAVAFNEAAFADAPLSIESEQAMSMANALSRAMRLVRFRRKIAGGYQGPILVAEGDSWFEYPIVLDDVIDHLNKHYAIFSLAGAGHHLAEMVANDEFTGAIAAQGADFFLLSGGGNDMLGGARLTEFLHPFQPGMSAAAVLNRSKLDPFLQQTAATLRSLTARLTQRFPALIVLAHGYDYAIPRSGGTWLGGPLAARGVDLALWQPVVALLIDAFNQVLEGVAAQFPSRFFHIDCRRTVGAPDQWHDELHPFDAGYGRAAQRFIDRIEVLRAAAPVIAAAPVAMGAPGFAAGAAGTASLPEFAHALRQVRASAQSAAGDLSRPEAAAALLAAQSAVQNSLQSAAQGAAFALPAALSAEAAPLVAPVLPKTRASKSPIERRAAELAQSLPLDAVSLAALAPDLAAPVHSEALVGHLPEAAPLPPPPGLPSGPSAPPCMPLESWRARLDAEDNRAWQHYLALMAARNQPESAATTAARIELSPANDFAVLERIVGDSNLYQINYLARGERAARAVGRVACIDRFGILRGHGTGMLVAPGLLLTNHHVLPDAEIARHSHVIFDYEYDADNGLRQTERFDCTPDLFVTSATHDFSFVSLAPASRASRPLADFGALTLIRASGKALKREFVSIIQHAGGLPKQLAIRDSEILGRMEQFIYYVSDTESGSSGSPVLNDDWLPVALHHRAVPNFDKPCDYVANRGIRISAIFEQLDELALQQEPARRVLALLEPAAPPTAAGEDDEHNDGGEGDRGGAAPVVAPVTAPVTGPMIEAMVEPQHEGNLDQRKGYNRDFLGVRVPLPTLTRPEIAALPIGATKPLLRYEHFSLVMHRERRLALFTAANVDLNPQARRPEAGKSYTRKALGGLKEGDVEKWFLDPRLDPAHQLSDRFFTRDGGAFDKGHIVRRDDMTWGESYAQVQRANGDTFHVTNCSPQVGNFNQAAKDGLWGQLEDLVFEQVDTERCSLFAGPLLQESDRRFEGSDLSGPVLVQIPARYWKVVVVPAPGGKGVESFAFLLEQDLAEVELEAFNPNAAWRQRMVTLAALQALIGTLRFADVLHRGDQARAAHGRALQAANGLELLA